MLSENDYLAMDALAMAQGLERGDFSRVELNERAIARAEQCNPALNAINLPLYEQGLERAGTLDEAPEPSGALAGVPFLLKDLSDLKGFHTSYGSELFRNYVARSSSPGVQLYEAAGLTILGKTNTPEFGLTLTTEPVATGPTRNPWHTDYSTGGSSGGAAAAVAAGIVPVAQASDGGGSIRIPASCCGLFGLKPSRGLTQAGTVLSENWSGMAVEHVVSRTVRDSAAFLDLITLPVDQNLFARPESPASFLAALDTPCPRLRIGIQDTHPTGEALDGECVEAVQAAAAHCESLGHVVEPFDHPLNYEALNSVMGQLVCVHTWRSIVRGLRYYKIELDEAPLERSTRFMAGRGAEIPAVDYLAARDLLRIAEKQMAKAHEQVDVIVSPVLAKTPAKLGWLDMNGEDQREYVRRFREYSGFTAVYNGTGQPSMSMPLHRTAEGLPVGVMFTAAWGGDLLLLQLAKQLEAAAPWPQIAP
ncbi:MAG: amidase [Gammaproteobacteria bacterium]|nr:amidase [Gammaproteobacteria bacterium]MYE30886.1 amidase [Gammaproteobacteria bacterium]MYI01250.1 amidase [Gammaproteobacteria bacterium]